MFNRSNGCFCCCRPCCCCCVCALIGDSFCLNKAVAEGLDAGQGEEAFVLLLLLLWLMQRFVWPLRIPAFAHSTCYLA
jgi:hypothetical protein